jgi:nicotinamide-nucleotide amidase
VVHLGVSGAAGTTVRTIRVEGARHEVRSAAVGAVFDLLRARLVESSAGWTEHAVSPAQ